MFPSSYTEGVRQHVVDGYARRSRRARSEVTVRRESGAPRRDREAR
jgi:hypothetical protein